MFIQVIPHISEAINRETLFPIVQQSGAEEIVREALNEAARHAGIGIREMHMAYERHLATVAAQRPALQLNPSDAPLPPVVKGGGLTTPEEDLVLFLLRHDAYFVPVAQALPLEWIDQAGRGGLLLMALLNEAVHGHFSGVREALNALDDDLRAEAARLAAGSFNPAEQADEILPHVNGILKSFHARHTQGLVRSLDARIASADKTDIATLNALQTEKIRLRKLHASPPVLTL